MVLILVAAGLGGAVLREYDARRRQAWRTFALLAYAESFSVREHRPTSAPCGDEFLAFLPPSLRSRIAAVSPGSGPDSETAVVYINDAFSPAANTWLLILLTDDGERCYVVRRGKRTPIAPRAVERLLLAGKPRTYAFDSR